MSHHVDISKFQIASFFLETVTFCAYIEIFFNYSIDKEKKMILLVQRIKLDVAKINLSMKTTLFLLLWKKALIGRVLSELMRKKDLITGQA